MGTGNHVSLTDIICEEKYLPDKRMAVFDFYPHSRDNLSVNYGSCLELPIVLTPALFSSSALLALSPLSEMKAAIFFMNNKVETKSWRDV